MNLREGTPRATYDEVLGGHHPVLKTPREKLDGPERQSVALYLYQREAFTPLCLNLAERVQTLPQSEIADITGTFKTQPGLQSFIEPDLIYTAIHELVRYKYMDLGPEYMLEEYHRLNGLYDKKEMSPKDASDFLNLKVYFHFNTPGALSEYNQLLNKNTPLTNKEQTKVRKYENELCSWDTTDTEKIVQLTNAPTEEAQLDGFIMMLMHMGQNAHVDDIARIRYGKYQSYFWAQTEAQMPHFSSSLVFAPIGQYGEQLAYRNLLAGRVFVKLADRFSTQDAQHVQSAYPELVAHKTTRGRDEEPLHCPIPPLATAQEGATSITNSVSLLTAELSDGYDAKSIVPALVEKGLVNELAGRLYSGFLQPTLFAGRYVEGLLVPGSLRFSRTFREYMDYKKDTNTELRLEGIDPEDQFTYHGCPVATREPGGESSGIEALSRAYLHVFDSVA